jgi:hypothetical protein
MRLKSAVSALAIAASLSTAPVSAAVLFQSIPDLTANPLTNAWCSSCGGEFRVFDTFTLSSGSVIQSISFNVQTSYYFPTSVDVSIWSMSGSLPGSQLLGQNFAPASFVSVVNNPNDTSTVTVNVGSWALAAGTYDISFYNPQNLGVPGYGGGSGLLYQQGEGFHAGHSAGFVLDGVAAVVPEPSTWAMMFIGFMGLAFATRRKAKLQG